MNIEQLVLYMAIAEYGDRSQAECLPLIWNVVWSIRSLSKLPQHALDNHNCTGKTYSRSQFASKSQNEIKKQVSLTSQ